MPDHDEGPRGLRAALEWMRATRARRVLTDVVAVVLVVVIVGIWQTRDHVRGEAPDVSLTERDGSIAAQPFAVGAPTLVVFFAPWCTVCRAESGNVSRVMRLFDGHARVVAVASAYDDIVEVDRYVADVGVDYPVLFGGEEAARAFRVRAFPTTYVLDGEGRVVSSAVGYTTTLGLAWRLLAAM